MFAWLSSLNWPRRWGLVLVVPAVRETWTKPLESVPEPLLDYSSRKCTPANTEAAAGGGEEGTLGSCVLSRLEEQTEIPNGGAVILPIAIYK